jgi:hypothetical protein
MVPHSILAGVPTITSSTIPEYCQDFDPSINIADLRSHAYEAQMTNAGITNFGEGAQALLTVCHPDGAWGKHTLGPKPTWAFCEENEEYGQAVAEWYKIPYGRPNDVELTHWSRFGPPGVGEPSVPKAVTDLREGTALLVNTGRDIWAKMQGMFANVLAQQTATASGTTSITTTGTPFVSSAYIGMVVVDNTTGVWGLIQSNTTSVLTVDRWYNPATPAGTAGSTPGATDKFTIIQGAPPAQFIAVSTTNSAPVSTDTTMGGEITTAGGGFLRTQATYTHSAGTNTYTMANTFTANGSDTGSLPYVIYRMGLFNGMVVASTITMMFETSLNASATITVSGDALTVTDTITGS